MTEVFGIKGYGINYDQISNYLDRAKLVDYVFEGAESDDEALALSKDQLLIEALDMQDSIVDFVYADRVTGYIMIQQKLPWEMWHSDYRELFRNSETSAKEYMWEKVSEFLDGRLNQEDFYLLLDYIDDTAIG